MRIQESYYILLLHRHPQQPDHAHFSVILGSPTTPTFLSSSAAQPRPLFCHPRQPSHAHFSVNLGSPTTPTFLSSSAARPHPLFCHPRQPSHAHFTVILGSPTTPTFLSSLVLHYHKQSYLSLHVTYYMQYVQLTDWLIFKTSQLNILHKS